MTDVILTKKYEDVIKHAVSHCDKRLLNCIELELIMLLEIQPTSGKGYRAIAIGQFSGQLLVLWEANGCSCCLGDGYVYARGNNGMEYEFICPECDGSSEGIFQEDDLVTDIDGCEINNIDFEDVHFDDFLSGNPLRLYEAANKRKNVSADEVTA